MIRYLNLIAALILFIKIVKITHILKYPPIFTPNFVLVLFFLFLNLFFFLFKVEKKIFNILVSLFAFLLFFNSSNITSLPEILKTPLFIFHVSLAILSYVFSFLAFIFFLLNEKEKRIKFLIFLSFLFFSLSTIIGGYWAYISWGNIFLIDSKVLFSIFYWLYILFLLHLNSKEKKLYKISYVFLPFVVIYSGFLINFIFKGSHGF